MTDIQFGEVEFQGPESSARPDEDAHFAVVECGELDKSDLPIYVDLDVLRDMEAHARTNTNVELGGVMLGGQFIDRQGNPFVIISDSLRAEHFEATKGSFKFTHETWQEITRRRHEFADDLQMVGWYHTHPDWGVFLSGMDLFICDHFFNRPLDVALVIDPCRDDRGWFHWNNATPPKTRETSGFYLMTNRFREGELNFFKSMYSAEPIMSADPRYSGAGSSIVQPVVNINDNRTPIQTIAIMGMLTIQLLVLALLSYKLLSDDKVAAEEKVAGLETQIATFGLQETNRAQKDAYSSVISQLTGNSEEGITLADSLAKANLENQELRNSAKGHAALAASAEQNWRSADALVNKRTEELENQKANFKKEVDENIQLKDEIKRLMDDAKEPAIKPWVYYVLAGIVGILGLAGGYWLGGKELGQENHEKTIARTERGSGRKPIADDEHSNDEIEIE